MRKPIEIWEPRWKDRMVLVSVKKIKEGMNYIIFTRTKALQGLYSFHSDDVAECSVTSNGKIQCLEIPLSLLEKVEDENQITF